MDSLEFYNFHISNRNYDYKMVNVNKSEVVCNVVYFPIRETYEKGKLVEYKEPRALIHIKKDKGFDFREVPYFYLKL